MNPETNLRNKINPTVPDIFPSESLICGFTTRLGGISSPPFDSLNLGYATPDEQSAVCENHNILYRYLGVDASNAAFMEQVHGGFVCEVDSGGISPGADGIITSKPGILLGVKCADCIPLLLFDPVRMAAGAIHCGWRPIVAGIAVKALNLMAENHGSNPGDIIAVLGPSAGPCCYEVGTDVAGRLNHGSVINRNGKLYADLRAELKHRLLDYGLNARNIEIIPHCTICNKSLYFSYRRDGSLSGRTMGYIVMK